MYRTGDIVVRVTEPMEGGFHKGIRDIVKEVLNDKEFTLENHEGIYLQRNFRLDKMDGEIGQVSDLEALEKALEVIDNWNRTQPTGNMVSIEAYPAQDGGSLFTTPSFDTHDIGSMMGHLLAYASDKEKAATLERAAQVFRFGA